MDILVRNNDAVDLVDDLIGKGTINLIKLFEHNNKEISL